jgi:predicted MFS family arabinose efflux permease
MIQRIARNPADCGTETATMTIPTSEVTSGQDRDISLSRLMTLAMTARLLIDTFVQIFNPFLSIIAVGLGVDVVTLGRLLSLRSLMGLVAPVYGTMADRRGYRRVMRLTLLLLAAGCLIIGLSASVWQVALGMAVGGLGLAGFNPTLQAYLSARLPYARRARFLGILEYTWALTGIVGLFLVGQLIALTNWRVPFWVLAAGLAAMWAVFATLPAARHVRPVSPSQPAPVGFGSRMRDLVSLESNARATYSAIVAVGCCFFAAMQLMITYGAWLNQEYGLTAAALGVVALVLGLFDLCASVSVSLFTDRIGKRRSVVLGMAGALLGYLLLPWLNVSLTLAVLGIALARGFFEFAIVSSFPLQSELVPSQRAKVMALSSAVGLLGTTLAGFSGPWLYTYYGVGGLALVSALAAAAGLLLILARVPEPGDGLQIATDERR